MVLAVLADILVTKGLREALPFITGLVEATPEASARSILTAARAAGLSFSNQPAFNLVAQLKANLSIREKFKLTAFDQLPSLDSLEKAVSPLSKNYSFLVKITGFNSATGERERRFVTVVSDSLLSPESILRTANSLPTGNPGSQVLSNQTVSIESASISPFAPGQ